MSINKKIEEIKPIEKLNQKISIVMISIFFAIISFALSVVILKNYKYYKKIT